MTQGNEKYNDFNHCIEEIDFINDKKFSCTVINFCEELVYIKLETRTKNINIKLSRKQIKLLLKKLNNLNL